MRLVSLACSNTEIVAALGRGAWLVGVDDHSDRPAPLVAELPRVGPDLQVDVARVAALKPDLVLASLTVPGHERVVAALEAAALPHLVLAPKSLEDVYRDIRRIAAALDCAAQGERLVRAMRRALEPRLPDVPIPGLPRPRVLVQWWNRPTIAPGRDSWVADLVWAAGGENALDELVASRPLSDAEVAALDPDLLVVSWCGVDPARYRPEVVAGNPALARVAAIRRGQLACVPEAHLGRPGPGLVAGFTELVRLVERARRAMTSAVAGG